MANRHPRERGLPRLPSHDYRTAGAYWITIDTTDRFHHFGEVRDGLVILSEAGSVVEKHLQNLPARASVVVDAYVIMPNHVHMILMLLPKSDDPLEVKSAKSLERIMQTFKTYAAIEINRLRGTVGKPVWQRNYFDRIIRSEAELNRFRQYIADNPLRWNAGNENPSTLTGM